MSAGQQRENNMKMINFSKQADNQFVRICKRLDDNGQREMKKIIGILERRVRKSLVTYPPKENEYNHMNAITETLLHQYNIVVIGWICECCGTHYVEVAHIEEKPMLCLN